MKYSQNKCWLHTNFPMFPICRNHWSQHQNSHFPQMVSEASKSKFLSHHLIQWNHGSTSGSLSFWGTKISKLHKMTVMEILDKYFVKWILKNNYGRCHALLLFINFQICTEYILHLEWCCLQLIPDWES